MTYYQQLKKIKEYEDWIITYADHSFAQSHMPLMKAKLLVLKNDLKITHLYWRKQ